MLYDTEEEARLRLNETVVLYDDQPVLIHNIQTKFSDGGVILDLALEVYHLPDLDRRTLISLKDARLNTKHLSLGYLNIFGDGVCSSLYLRRIPIRRYKQGLCEENVYIPLALQEDRFHPPAQRRAARRRDAQYQAEAIENKLRQGTLNFSDIRCMVTFKDMLMGSYPSFNETLQMLDAGQPGGVSREIAFCKMLSVGRDENLGIMFLNYKGAQIAFSFKAEDVFTLPLHYSHLKELLEEKDMRIKVAEG